MPFQSNHSSVHHCDTIPAAMMAGEVILSFADEIQKQVQASDCEGPGLHLDETTGTKLDRYLSQLPLLIGTSSSSIRRRFDHLGTELWNICTQRMTGRSDPTSLVLLCKVKALAWAMLDVAVPDRSLGSFGVLDAAFKLVKACTENDCIAISLKVIEAVAIRLDALEHSEADVDRARLHRCNVQYYMLRVHLAWLQGRPDIADHLYLRVPESSTGNHCVLDVCFKVGSSALSGGQHGIAAKWLERGWKQCNLLIHADGECDVALNDKELLVLHALGGGILCVGLFKC
ncbi:uncharacterized protein BO97DRAFT_13817 [Aspergillus homomorphus CBS 101889]|uniref:Protein ZIP4 homolog n=1 Tax=Aspergillus homomorphus (strain CBS 101889) TaxID=1450537 RepID=A0A395ICM0_ASPHC|nr:hypothetical protein BO97DRAFT_13817 [Aspergillus homomorphus CBS 101889]RAL17745.1 hypothetical protein BO97DRAFT_13817 [Aspergillus homomorphus CBS 101889]